MQIVSGIGLTAGTLALAISVYLQLLCSTDIEPKYVLMFWLLGVVMITANFDSVIHSEFPVVAIQVVTYSLVTIAEIWLAKEIVEHAKESESLIDVAI